MTASQNYFGINSDNEKIQRSNRKHDKKKHDETKRDETKRDDKRLKEIANQIRDKSCDLPQKRINQ